MDTIAYRENGELKYASPAIASSLENESKWREAREVWKQLAKVYSYYKKEVDTLDFMIDCFDKADAERERLRNDPEFQMLCIRVKIEKGEELTEEEKKLVNSKLKV